jgi:hypothetical protein
MVGWGKWYTWKETKQKRTLLSVDVFILGVSSIQCQKFLYLNKSIAKIPIKK